MILDRLSAETVAQARRTSPETFLRRHYRDVVVDRRGGIAVLQTLRLDFVDDRWVACDWQGGPVGDNVALVQWVQPGLSFPEAIFALTGIVAELPPTPRQPPVEKATTYPRLPPEAPRHRGVAYLTGRGISTETIAAAEAAGALRHAANGVVFLGRDHSTEAVVRSATIRYFEPQTAPDGDVLTKRDFSNSDKAFPFLLPGGTSRVVVAEGAVNALAARDLALRSGWEPPTAIGTGGVGIRSWVRTNGPLKAVLTAADVVEVWGENEVGRDGCPDPTKQGRTDELRRKLQGAIAELRAGELPEILYPPEGIKDAAEWNLALIC